PHPLSSLGLLEGLLEVLGSLVDGDLRRVGGLLEVVVRDVGGIAVVVVRHTATAGQAHGWPPLHSELTDRCLGLYHQSTLILNRSGPSRGQFERPDILVPSGAPVARSALPHRGHRQTAVRVGPRHSPLGRGTGAGRGPGRTSGAGPAG